MKNMRYVKDKIGECNSLMEISDSDFLDFEEGYAYIVAKSSKNLKPTQLRKFFNVIKKMEKKDEWKEIETDFYLLKPRMAVATGRKNLTKPFFEVMMMALSKVDNEDKDKDKMENFYKFVKFFEAVIAYHKFLYPYVR